MNDQYIYCDYDSEAIPDWKKASQHIYPLPENLVVEMIPPKETTQGGIFLPETALFTHYDENDAPIAGIEPSVGVVIGVGLNCEPFRYGDLVLCRDGDGICIDGFVSGDYEAQNEVRVFGQVVPSGFGPGYSESMPIEESIFAVIDGERYAATGKNILIKKDPFETSHGIIQTLSHTQERNLQATVVEVGPDVELEIFDPETLEPRTIRPGDRVLYIGNAQWDIRRFDNPDLSFIRERSILAVLA